MAKGSIYWLPHLKTRASTGFSGFPARRTWMWWKARAMSIKLILTRHEQGAAFVAANGFAG